MSSPRFDRTENAAPPPATVLVTGGAGFVGSSLAAALLKQGHTVYVVDNLITGRAENLAPLRSNPRFQFWQLDVTSPDFSDTFASIPVTHIYHLACPTGVPNIERLGKEMMLTCSTGTLNVLEVARRHQARILFTSSCEVYGQAEVFPQHEEYAGNVSPVGPRSAYEEGKRFSEALMMRYARQESVATRIVRLFNVYGPAMSPHDTRVLPRFLKAIQEGQPLQVYGHGRQTRTFVYVDDVLRALQLVMHQGPTGSIYNIGGDQQVTMKDLAETVIALAKSNSSIVHLPHFTEDHRDRLPSVKKIKELGWQQTVTLKDGLGRMMDAWGIRQTVSGPVLSPALNKEALVAPLD